MSAYLDYDLRRHARARLERHTAECADCRRVLGELRRLLALLHGQPLSEPATDGSAFATAVLRRLHESADH
jgi:anti-sigma factor RsiW